LGLPFPPPFPFFSFFSVCQPAPSIPRQTESVSLDSPNTAFFLSFVALFSPLSSFFFPLTLPSRPEPDAPLDRGSGDVFCDTASSSPACPPRPFFFPLFFFPPFFFSLRSYRGVRKSDDLRSRPRYYSDSPLFPLFFPLFPPANPELSR